MRTAQHVNEKLLVQLKELPDQNVELLSEVDLLHRVGEVGLQNGAYRAHVFSLTAHGRWMHINDKASQMHM